MKIVRNPSYLEVKDLLESSGLPINDLTPENMKHFSAAWEDSRLEGVVGIELLGTDALLRSLAVVTSKRGTGLGASLLAEMEQYAVKNGVTRLFVITTTAESYFNKHGYINLSREAAPETIRSTQEFSSICPDDAVLMVKQL